MDAWQDAEQTLSGSRGYTLTGPAYVLAVVTLLLPTSHPQKLLIVAGGQTQTQGLIGDCSIADRTAAGGVKVSTMTPSHYRLLEGLNRKDCN